MRVVVTGGAGFIGSHVVDDLVLEGHDVLIVDDLSTGLEANLNPSADFVKMDIVDHGLTALLAKFCPDAVSHLAAQTSVTVSVADPVLDARTNVHGALNVLNASMSAEVERFIYVTTGGALYGEPDYIPCDEEHPVRPSSPYGLSKWTFERYLGVHAPDGMLVQVLRLANVYGPRQPPGGESGVVSILGSLMLASGQVTIFGDGEQSRDYVYVSDVVAAHHCALDNKTSATVNISTGVGTTVNQVFDKLAGETGYERPPVYAPARTGELKTSVLANGRAAELLGWSPKVPMGQGLRNTLVWLNGREGE